jgi:hypothetical protein
MVKTKRVASRTNHLHYDGRDLFALKVLSKIPKKLGGLGLQNFGTHDTDRVISVRKGILERILLRGKEGEACGYPKLKQQDYETSFGHEFGLTRTLFKEFMVVRNYENTPYGMLPSLTPNPFNFLKQVGYDLKGIPERVSYKPEVRMKFRFKRSTTKGSDWKSVMHDAIRAYEEELKNVKSSNKENSRQAVSDDQTSSISYWFTRERWDGK